MELLSWILKLAVVLILCYQIGRNQKEIEKINKSLEVHRMLIKGLCDVIGEQLKNERREND